MSILLLKRDEGSEKDESFQNIPKKKLKIVFYNGTDKMPNETVLELKNAFPENIRDRSDVEVRVRMININAGHCNEIMRKSETLREYAWFVETVRTKLDSLKDVFLTEEEKSQNLPDSEQ